MSEYLSNKYSSLTEYTPGEQPRDKKYIKLNTNESPYPPSEKVVKAITEDEIRDLRLYSDPECSALKEALSSRYAVKKENIFVSNGSDDILNFAFMAYGEKGAVFPDITYGFYSVFAELHGVRSYIGPLKADFSLDTEKISGQNKLTVIANPNAPTGMALTLKDIEKITASNEKGITLIDEAYVDFGAESCAGLISRYKNLLCVQTFSKSRSLAGGRLGFAIADGEIIKDLEKIKYSTNPYNVNRLTQKAGAAALEDGEYYRANCKKIIKTREFTKTALENLGFEVLPSAANFLFAKSPHISGGELYLKLKAKGVLVRHFDKERIREYNRITIGSPEEMEIFIEKVKEILGE